jgi:cation diffusion facilitator family transporter
VAAYFSHSVAMLAEAVHSTSDTGNQLLLLIGMRLAMRPPSERHPFGRSGEYYFWPFVVSLLLFSLGGAFGVYEGVHKLRHPGLQTTGGQAAWAYAVLGTSIVFELYSFSVAAREFRQIRRGRRVREVLLDGRDVTVPLVLMEDTSALAGLTVALVGVVVSHVWHFRAADAIASLVIGAILCCVAVFLAYETHGLLIGEAATREDRAKVEEIVTGMHEVRRLVEILTLHLGPRDVVLALKIAFDPDMKVPALEDAINELERRVRRELPHMTRIFVEPDSVGEHEAPPREVPVASESS